MDSKKTFLELDKRMGYSDIDTYTHTNLNTVKLIYMQCI